MAKVYKATDTTLDRPVAVKLINADLRNESEFDARFQREARIASQLADPHIVVVHDFGIDPVHGPFLVMEYLEGQSLRERLSAGGPLPLKAGLQLAGQLILALMHAHSKGIVHRDVKPDNIFVLNQSGVRLHTRVLDFGIARIYKRDDPSRVDTITHAGAVLGTPRYMSPEQLAGQPVEARSDLYSAALVIFEALTGQVPYPGGKRLCELCKEATPALQDLVEQCLKPNAAERPPTAVEVYLRLQELGKASGILLLPPGAMDRLVAARKASEPTEVYKPKAGGKPGKRALILGAAVLVLLAALAGGYGLYKVFGGGGDAPKGPESIADVKVGAEVADVKERLQLKRQMTGDPWGPKSKVKAHLGHVLAAADLEVPEDAMERVVTHYTGDDPPSTVVIVFEGKVKAIVTRDHHTHTGQRVKYDSKADEVRARYGFPPRAAPVDTAEGQEQVWRYDERGLGVELRNNRVVRLTLYPPPK
jgi:tRNA A-37 threonylcarbamoyl transferase component Bud32